MRTVLAEDVACPLRVGDFVKKRGEYGVVVHASRNWCVIRLGAWFTTYANLSRREWPKPVRFTRRQRAIVSAAIAAEALRRIDGLGS